MMYMALHNLEQDLVRREVGPKWFFPQSGIPAGIEESFVSGIQ